MPVRTLGWIVGALAVVMAAGPAQTAGLPLYRWRWQGRVFGQGPERQRQGHPDQEDGRQFRPDLRAQLRGTAGRGALSRDALHVRMRRRLPERGRAAQSPWRAVLNRGCPGPGRADASAGADQRHAGAGAGGRRQARCQGLQRGALAGDARRSRLSEDAPAASQCARRPRRRGADSGARGLGYDPGRLTARPRRRLPEVRHAPTGDPCRLERQLAQRPPAAPARVAGRALARRHLPPGDEARGLEVSGR